MSLASTPRSPNPRGSQNYPPPHGNGRPNHPSKTRENFGGNASENDAFGRPLSLPDSVSRLLRLADAQKPSRSRDTGSREERVRSARGQKPVPTTRLRESFESLTETALSDLSSLSEHISVSIDVDDRSTSGEKGANPRKNKTAQKKTAPLWRTSRRPRIDFGRLPLRSSGNSEIARNSYQKSANPGFAKVAARVTVTHRSFAFRHCRLRCDFGDSVGLECSYLPAKFPHGMSRNVSVKGTFTEPGEYLANLRLLIQFSGPSSSSSSSSSSSFNNNNDNYNSNNYNSNNDNNNYNNNDSGSCRNNGGSSGDWQKELFIPIYIRVLASGVPVFSANHPSLNNNNSNNNNNNNNNNNSNNNGRNDADRDNIIINEGGDHSDRHSGNYNRESRSRGSIGWSDIPEDYDNNDDFVDFEE